MRTWPASLAIVCVATAARADDPPPPPEPPPGDVLPPVEPPPDDILPPGDPTLGPPGASEPDAGDPDAAFGPLILIERIEIRGNRSTAERVIRRALPVRAGDRMRAGDPRLTSARFKLLALGYFRDVSLQLDKGSARGQVILKVTVSERGTIVLRQLWFGTSVLSPWWLGADLTERNFLGSGIAVGGGFAYADHGAVAGARDQWAGELRLRGSAIAGSRWGANGAFTIQHGSEPFRVGGPPDSTSTDDFRAFPYRRLGGRAGVRRDLSPAIQADAELRVEQIDADLPDMPTRTLPGGQVIDLDLGLEQGRSHVVSLRFGLERDTRADPVLPRGGSRVKVTAELGSSMLGGDYDFAAILVRGERWWPLAARHSIGVRMAGGVILGDAPRFERIHVADVDRLLTPRVLDMTVATSGAPDLFGTGNPDVVYGDVGGNLVVEYSYRWFRRARTIYGGDLFVAAGVWGLADADDPRRRALGDSLQLDPVVDAGLRIDTEVGIFEFTVANALGRVAR